jgi:hypothetical protein
MMPLHMLGRADNGHANLISCVCPLSQGSRSPQILLAVRADARHPADNASKLSLDQLDPQLPALTS